VSIKKRYLQDGSPRWDVRHHSTGSRPSVTCKTAAEAKRVNAEFERQSGLGAFADPLPSKQLVREYLTEWYARERHGWKTSTAERYADLLALWIVPYIAPSARLSAFAEKAVADWLGSIRAAGASATQASGALRVLSSALGAAVRDRSLRRNPCAAVRKPKVAVSRPRPFSPLEVEQLRAAMPSPRDAVIVSVLCYAGLRVGEALGLSWDSVWLDEGYLLVEQSHVKGEVKGTKTGLIRRVELCSALKSDLAAVRPENPAPGAFVAPSRQGGGGPLDRHNWTNRVWTPAAKRAGVAGSPGDGRHTFASLHLNAGEPLISVSNQLGHAMTRTTEIYSHLMPRDLIGRGLPMDAAILAARRELAGERGLNVDELAALRAKRATG
jgi:integrase